MMRTARAIGLSVADVALIDFAGQRALVAERFDRVVTPEGVERVHQEDCCQALGVWPTRKYESEGGPGVGTLATLISSVSTNPAVDLQRFVQAVIFNALIGGTDAHARNYGLLLAKDATRFAPLYDLNTWAAFGSLADAELAMRIGTQTRVGSIRARHWCQLGAAAGIPEKAVLAEVRRQQLAIPPALARERDILGPPAQRSATVARALRQIADHLAA